MGEAEERRKLTLIFDANVIIASLTKESGLNRFIVTTESLASSRAG